MTSLEEFSKGLELNLLRVLADRVDEFFHAPIVTNPRALKEALKELREFQRESQDGKVEEPRPDRV